ncbi:hypothetical protein Hdeb2414_s0122g00803871 [Helianthus debilis subsp. tardiflorus]
MRAGEESSPAKPSKPASAQETPPPFLHQRLLLRLLTFICGEASTP